jgi:hypothetical protein
VYILFGMDAKGQTLEEKMVEGKFVLGDGREKWQSPDSSGRSYPLS